MTDQQLKNRIFAGRYQYITPLGRGAGGSVYLADDLHMPGRKVALKVLTADADKTVQGKMLRREFEILSKLDHPNLVEVFDYGSLPDGGVFLAEEYIDGFSLQDARALLEPQALVDITFQILLALTYLHGMGWIHRDIKPANVMLLWLDDAHARPIVKLVDFGLSSMNPKRDTLRGGTRSYMAPEITRGEKGELRSDLYSLGVTLYYALCGVLPFGPRSKDDPPPTEEAFRPPEPHRLNPAVPLTLSRFTMALLRQLADFEYADAGEALQDLVRDSELLQDWSGGSLSNSLDIAASPVIKGYFERGILPQRDAERDAVVDRISGHTRPGTGILQLLAGAPGVGKSRLMREIAAMSKLNARLVVSADCARIAARSTPTGSQRTPARMKRGALIHELLRRIVEIGSSNRIHQIERYRSYLLILERMSHLADGEELTFEAGASVDAEWIREAFEDAVVMLHPQKVTLFIEDFHLADDFSRKFFADWYTRAQSFHRPDTVATVAADRLDPELERCEAVEIRVLQGLSREDVQAFFQQRLGLSHLPECWLDDVTSHANGQPFYLHELCLNLIGRGILRRPQMNNWQFDPDALRHYKLARNVRESFRRRFAAVSASGRECLELLNLVGRPLLWRDLRDLLVAGGASTDSAERAMNALAWGHMISLRLTLSSRYVRLADDAVAEVLADLSSPKWNRALHRRIGELMARRWVAGGADAFEAAEHLQRGGLKDDASTYFELAGDQAWRQADYVRALASFQAAAELRDAGPAAAVAQLKCARCLLAAYDPDACRQALARAAQLAEHSALDWLMYSVFYAGILIGLSLGDDGLAGGFLQRLRTALPAFSYHAEVQRLEAILMRRRGDLRGAVGKLVACVDQSRQHNEPAVLVPSLLSLADLTHIRGDVALARTYFDEALGLARALNEPIALGRALSHYGSALTQIGKPQEGLELLTESLEYLSDGQSPDEWIDALLRIALCKMTTGDQAEARRYTADAQVFARQLKCAALQARAAFLLAEIALYEGQDPAAALADMEHQLQQLQKVGADVCRTLELRIRFARATARAGLPGAETLRVDAQRDAESLGALLWTQFA